MDREVGELGKQRARVGQSGRKARGTRKGKREGECRGSMTRGKEHERGKAREGKGRSGGKIGKGDGRSGRERRRRGE